MRKIVIGLFIRFKGNGPKFTESTEWKEWNTVCIRSQNCKQDYSEWQHFHCWGRHLPLSLISLLSCSFLPVHQKSLTRTAPSGNQKERRQRDCTEDNALRTANLQFSSVRSHWWSWFNSACWSSFSLAHSPSYRYGVVPISSPCVGGVNGAKWAFADQPRIDENERGRAREDEVHFEIVQEEGLNM